MSDMLRVCIVWVCIGWVLLLARTVIGRRAMMTMLRTQLRLAIWIIVMGLVFDAIFWPLNLYAVLVRWRERERL
jgi:hypothetical protein